MLNRVVRVTPLPGYCLRVEFADGVSGTVDLADELTGEMFEPLRDEARFREVAIDEYGALCWPNGADLAPDALYRDLATSSEPPVRPKRTRQWHRAGTCADRGARPSG